MSTRRPEAGRACGRRRGRARPAGPPFRSGGRSRTLIRMPERGREVRAEVAPGSQNKKLNAQTPRRRIRAPAPAPDPYANLTAHAAPAPAPTAPAPAPAAPMIAPTSAAAAQARRCRRLPAAAPATQKKRKGRGVAGQRHAGRAAGEAGARRRDGGEGGLRGLVGRKVNKKLGSGYDGVVDSIDASSPRAAARRSITTTKMKDTAALDPQARNRTRSAFRSLSSGPTSPDWQWASPSGRDAERATRELVFALTSLDPWGWRGVAARHGGGLRPARPSNFPEIAACKQNTFGS